MKATDNTPVPSEEMNTAPGCKRSLSVRLRDGTSDGLRISCSEMSFRHGVCTILLPEINDVLRNASDRLVLNACTELKTGEVFSITVRTVNVLQVNRNSEV